MHRFRVSPNDIRDDIVAIEGEEHRHLSRVLRLRPDDEIELTDGVRNLLARIEAVERDGTSCRIFGELPAREAGASVTLYMGAVKGEKMDWIVQKCCELGARAVVPVLMERSVRQEDASRRERRQRIADEAAKQSGRAAPLTVMEAVSFAEGLARYGAHDVKLLPYEEGGASLRGELAGLFGKNPDIAVWIGPEGGIDPAEAQALTAAGARAVTLGPRILRAETAAVAAVSAVMLLCGEWE